MTVQGGREGGSITWWRREHWNFHQCVAGVGGGSWCSRGSGGQFSRAGGCLPGPGGTTPALHHIRSRWTTDTLLVLLPHHNLSSDGDDSEDQSAAYSVPRHEAATHCWPVLYSVLMTTSGTGACLHSLSIFY